MSLAAKKLISIKQHAQVLQLTWFINNICTNHCAYCPPELHKGRNHNYDWEHARSFLLRLIEQHKKINCLILGGEPTISPFLYEAVELLHSGGHTISLTSNGVRSVEYWKKLAPLINNVSLSYHPGYEIEDFFKKVQAISEYTQVGVRVMFDSRYWNKALDFYNECLQIPYLRVDAVRILSEIAGGHTIGSEYSPDQLNWLSNTPSRQAVDSVLRLKRQNPNWKQLYIGSKFYYDDGTEDYWGDANRLISADKSFFNGWACSIGLESLYINYDGQVRKGNCRQGPDLFHINNHVNHALPTQGEICKMERCICPNDVLVTKFPVIATN